MTMRQFIRENREEIDKTIDHIVEDYYQTYGRKNNRERELWINNHEPLYLLAKSKGVKFD
jgi:hypothetical protein